MFKVSLWREDLLIVGLVIVCCVGAILLSGCGEVETGQIEQETSDRVSQVTPDQRIDINCAATMSAGIHRDRMPAPYCYSWASK